MSLKIQKIYFKDDSEKNQNLILRDYDEVVKNMKIDENYSILIIFEEVKKQYLTFPFFQSYLSLKSKKDFYLNEFIGGGGNVEEFETYICTLDDFIENKKHKIIRIS